MSVWAGSANCPQGGVGCLHECPTETITCDFQDQRLVMLVSLRWNQGCQLGFPLVTWFLGFRNSARTTVSTMISACFWSWCTSLLFRGPKPLVIKSWLLHDLYIWLICQSSSHVRGLHWIFHLQSVFYVNPIKKPVNHPLSCYLLLDSCSFKVISGEPLTNLTLGLCKTLFILLFLQWLYLVLHIWYMNTLIHLLLLLTM